MIENFLANYCLVCRGKRIQFEAKGIGFDEHSLNQHSIYDYISYFLRLLLKQQSDFNEDDHYMLMCYLNKQIKWAPVKRSIFLSILKSNEKKLMSCLWRILLKIQKLMQRDQQA